jgi:hypothetical protein
MTYSQPGAGRFEFGGVNMPTIVTDRPSDFVTYLTVPGLPVNDMNIPIKQYMCANPAYGGNAEASQVIGHANQKIYIDEATKTKISSKTTNIGRLTTGQGYPDDFILLMTHMADNMDRMRAAPELKNKSYFRDANLSTADVLKKMVQEKVYGLDCIGFVSQYLVFAGVWDAYKTYYPQDYTREFKPIKTLAEIERLCLVIWDNYHIGIIDNVQSLDEDANECTVDICQSSSGEEKGPQTNVSVTLKLSRGDFYQGKQKFRMERFGSPAMPVRSAVYICKMPELVWLGDLVPPAPDPLDLIF